MSNGHYSLTDSGKDKLKSIERKRLNSLGLNTQTGMLPLTPASCFIGPYTVSLQWNESTQQFDAASGI